MTKDEAIRLLGGTPAKAAASIGIQVQAVYQWRDPLTPIVHDRVVAALARKKESRTRRVVKSNKSFN